MCHLEQKLASNGMMLMLYRWYVDDTLARLPKADAAADFLTTLIGLHPSLVFTIELPVKNNIPFICIKIIKNGMKLQAQDHSKLTNTGLLLHFQSRRDKCYKDCLLKTYSDTLCTHFMFHNWSLQPRTLKITFHLYTTLLSHGPDELHH